MNSRAMMAMACAIAFVGNVWALPSYNYVEEERTLYVDVPEGESADFDTANYGALLTGNTITNLVKHGHGGTLSLGVNNFSAYTGQFTFTTGVVTFAAASALGADAAGADVHVKAGATLQCTVTGIKVGSTGTVRKKWIHYNGFGMNGKGAYYSSVGTSGGSHGINIVLEGDTLFQDERTFQLVYNIQIDMNGHTLHYKTVNSGNNNVLNGLNILNPGHIVSECGNAFIKDGYAWRGGPENTVTVKGLRSGLYNFPVNQGPEWTLILSSNTKDFWLGENNVDRGTPQRNRWNGPVRIDVPKLNVFTEAPWTNRVGVKGCGVSFAGKISGGGLNLLGNISGDKPNRANTHMHLSSPDNDFTNGVAVSLATLHVWTNGALPSAGGPLSVTNGTVVFDGASELYALPALNVHGTGLVENAGGQWKGVVKEGSGVFESRSWIGAPTLDVRGGTFKLPSFGSGIMGNPLAGLIGGVQLDGEVFVDYRNAIPSQHTEVYTNRIEKGPLALFNGAHEWWGLQNATGKRVVVYDGYLWSHAPTNETWTFAGACHTHFALAMNGNTVIYTTKGNGNISVASNCVVRPGPNHIQLRVYASSVNTGPGAVKETQVIDGVTYVSKLYPWDKGFPYYDPLGRCSSDPNDYLKLEDPGDGSLLTWALPGSDLPETLPGTDYPVADFPKRLFPAMSFAAGTTLDCSSLTQTVTTLTGYPTIANCERFTIEELWTVDTDGLLSGATLTTAGKLAFSEGAEIAVTQATAKFDADSAPVALATAAGGIEGMPVVTDSQKWRIWKSADEHTLYIAYKPKGITLYLK